MLFRFAVQPSIQTMTVGKGEEGQLSLTQTNLIKWFRRFYDATHNRYPWYPVELLRWFDTFDMSKHWSALNFRFVSTGSVTAQVCTSMVLQLGMLTDVVIWRSARHHYRLRHAKDSRLIDLRTCETWISVSWPNMEPHICSWSWLQETYEKKHVYLYISTSMCSSKRLK